MYDPHGPPPPPIFGLGLAASDTDAGPNLASTPAGRSEDGDWMIRWAPR
jgi:hypothetical protein